MKKENLSRNQKLKSSVKQTVEEGIRQTKERIKLENERARIENENMKAHQAYLKI